MSSKSLTGEHIWQTFVNHRLACRTWNDVTPQTQSIYDDIAKQLNEDLGLLEEPTSPQEPNTIVHEKGVYFILGYGPGEHDHVTIRKFEDINQAITDLIPYPDDNQSHMYYIRVCRDGQNIGFGRYKRTRMDIQVMNESDAAVGLNDALYEYAFNHC